MKRVRLKSHYRPNKELDKALCARAGGEWVDGHCIGAHCETCQCAPDWRGLSRSHRIPRSRGGENNLSNILIECYNCHSVYEKRPDLR